MEDSTTLTLPSSFDGVLLTHHVEHTDGKVNVISTAIDKVLCDSIEVFNSIVYMGEKIFSNPDVVDATYSCITLTISGVGI